jgi:serine/threonine protein kinase
MCFEHIKSLTVEVKKTPISQLLLCPQCSTEQEGVRCHKDQAYLVTKEASLGAQGDALLGHEIGGRYGVIERLGMGGMGAVYKAIDPRRGLTVAIKVLREAYAQHPAIRERFIREAEAGASLSHPNVVPLIDFGIEDSGRLWLAMEFAEGWTLRDEINHNGAFSVKEAVELMRQVLKGLAVAHDAGMIHRDLKHDNIMYFGRREKFLARIVDFGVVKSEAADLARTEGLGSSGWKPPKKKQVTGRDLQGAFDLSDAMKESEDSNEEPSKKSKENPPSEDLSQKVLTAVGMMVGSPSYMAPEQIRGLKVGPPADLYALAVVTYEILAARRLFTVNDYETLLKEDAKRDAPRLVFSARGELIPEPLADIIHNALAHDPTDRYPDAHTMLLALDQMRFSTTEIPLNLFCELPNFVNRSQPSAEISKKEEEYIDTTMPPPKSISEEVPQLEQEDVSNLNEDMVSLDSNLSVEMMMGHSSKNSRLIPMFFPPLIVMIVVWGVARFVI